MSTITLTKEQVDEAFGHARNYRQLPTIFRLYRLLFPDWDDIAKINGYPKAGTGIALYIIEKFIDYDMACLPDVMPGGAWSLGSGWSSSDEVEPWEVDISNCEVIYA